MRYKSKNSGFTLLEIIVVLVIVGLLAAVALPSLFSNVEKSRGAEAVSNLGLIRTAVEACIAKNSGDSTNCTTANIITGTTMVSSPNFGTYAISGVGTNGNYVITATAPSSKGTVRITKTGTTVTCSGTASYLGSC